MMKRLHLLLAAAVLGGGAIAGARLGAAAEDAGIPAGAGPDFAVQGEYRGMSGGKSIGANVIALGGGSLAAVFFSGGLPGEGWDGKTRTRVNGTLEEGAARFAQEGSAWTGSIAAGGDGYEIVRDGGYVHVVERLRRGGGGPDLEGRGEGGETFRLTRVARKSSTLGMTPPAGAVVLFDGKSADAWNGGKVSPEGHLQVGTTSKQSFQDFTLHMEFRLPYMPAARGQGRANSGVYLQNRYELQILDSFGLKGEHNECGGLYQQKAPDVNMCFPPMTWQTYDIDFRTARFEGDKKAKPAVATIRHNGVVIHDRYEFKGPTPGGRPESAEPGPFQLQNHGNPVVFRNVWVVEKKA